MQPMSEVEARALVGACRLGTLGLARDNRAYAIPLFYGYDGRSFYFHTHPGLKSEYLETTEEACLVIVQAWSEDVWASVIARGPLEEITWERDRLPAMDALLSVPLPPEWGFSEHGEPLRSGVGMKVLRLTPTALHGRKSERPLAEEADAALRGA